MTTVADGAKPDDIRHLSQELADASRDLERLRAPMAHSVTVTEWPRLGEDLAAGERAPTRC